MHKFLFLPTFKLSTSLYRVPPYPAGGSRSIPLKLKWGKKSGRYDLSQDVYVLTVNVGERPQLQCTLTTESIASELMEYIRQKMFLNQIDMFGLRFQMKATDPDERMMRWVEMDKPLRKQLEKWSCKPRQVYLAVLYHTPNAFILTDEIARSCYFCLMRNDVVEGRLTVEMEKYISLAAYSLQVEHGDYDPAVHTIDVMQTIPLLPKHICRSATILEDLLRRVLQVYEKLRGMNPPYAALLYIVDAMQCEGYGEEYFKGKDEDSSEVKVGYAPEGIVVRGSYGAPIKYVWDEIKEIVPHKRHLQLKLNDQRLVEYIMEDVDMCRYVAMVFNWQFHYATHKAIEDKNAKNDINDLKGGIKTFSTHHVSNTELNNTRLNVSQSDMHSSTQGGLSHRSTSSGRLNNSIHKPNSISLSNINSVHSADGRKYPLSSISFRHPMTVAVASPERSRAATSACFPLTSQLSPLSANGRMTSQTSNQSISGINQSITGPPTHRIQSMTSQLSNQSIAGSSHMIQMGGSQHLINNNHHSQLGSAGSQNGLAQQNQSQPAHGSQTGSHLQLSQTIPAPGELPIWHPNMHDDKNASYKALYPYAVEIGGPNQQRRPSDSIGQQNGGLPKKIMGSSPEMRLLGTQSDEAVAFVRDILNRRENDMMNNQAPRRDGFQSTPNLIDIHRLNKNGGFTTPMVQNIPPEPPFYPYPSPTKSALTSTPSGGSRAPIRESQERCSNTASSSSSNMRLFEDPVPTQSSSARHTLFNGVPQKDGDMLGEGKEHMSSLVETKLHSPMDVLRAEFMRIPNKRLSAGTSTSIKPENLPRNRTRSIVPYEDNRVMLRPTQKNPCGYVNASNVEVLIGGRRLQYILTQAPMKDTVDDFWATVWESGCHVIVMLSEAKLDGPNAPIYWPSNSSSKVETRDLIVKFKSISSTQSEVTTVLDVKNRSCGGRRRVYHMRYVGWNTGDVPEEHSLLAFMDSVSSVRRYVDNERDRNSSLGSKEGGESGTRKNLTDVSNRLRTHSITDGPSWKRRINSISASTSAHSPTLSIDSGDSGAPPSPSACLTASPLLIHCHSGSHESGVYLLAEVLVFCLEHNLSADIPTLLGKLRAQRMSLVKTVEQYRFVYSLLSSYLNQSRLI